jgi:hypothetical protein
MKIRFLGDFKKLEKCVLRTGVPGKWRKLEKGKMQYCTNDGVFLSWWKSSGTVTFQGKEEKSIRKLSEPFVRMASKKGLLKGERAPDDKIMELPGVISEIAKLKRQQKRMRIEIAELKEAVTRS